MRRSPALVACVALITGAFIGASPAMANGPGPARIDEDQILEIEDGFPTESGEYDSFSIIYLDGMLVDQD